MEGNTGWKGKIGQGKSDFQALLRNEFHSVPLSENNTEFHEEEHDFNSDVDEGLEVKMLYPVLLYKNATKLSIMFEMPLHKYVDPFKIQHFFFSSFYRRT